MGTGVASRNEASSPRWPTGPARRELRVLVVTNSWPDGERPWHGIFVKRQVDALRELGVEIDVLRIRGYAARSAYFAAAARAVTLNRQRDYDLVHAHYGHSGVVGRLQLRAPLVITYLGSDLLGTDPISNGLSRQSQIEATVFRQLARVAAATITQSEEMERLLPRPCRKRNRVIPDGVDLERFRPTDRMAARRRLGWPAEEATVLFVADPQRTEKNFPLAEAACRQLARTMPQIKLRVAATVEPAEIPLWMSAADALLLTSWAEGGPTTVKEAMAAELPVVSTPVGLVRERFHRLPGCWMRPPQADALADGLADALRRGRDPEARKAIASLGHDCVAARVARVYEEVVGVSRRVA